MTRVGRADDHPGGFARHEPESALGGITLYVSGGGSTVLTTGHAAPWPPPGLVLVHNREGPKRMSSPSLSWVRWTRSRTWR